MPRSAGAGCAQCRNREREGRLSGVGTTGQAQPPGRNCRFEEIFMMLDCKRLAHPRGAEKASDTRSVCLGVGWEMRKQF